MGSAVEDAIGVAEPSAGNVSKRLRTLRFQRSAGVVSAEYITQVPWARRIAWTGSDPEYIGWADAGSTNGEAVWRVCLYTYSAGNLISVMWADGDDLFDNDWSDRENLDYS